MSQKSQEQPAGGYQAQTYNFCYDALDRLIAANDPGGMYNVPYITYDLRGNIETLERYGVIGECAEGLQYGVMDQLSYVTASGSNILSETTDAAPRDFGYTSINGSGADSYVADAYGNITNDGKSGTTITYNVLNLPKQIGNANSQSNLMYDVDGIKYYKNVDHQTDDSYDEEKYYLGGIEYKGTQIEAIYVPERRAIKVEDNWRWEAFVKDHLGNTRVVLSDLDENGSISRDNLNGDDEILSVHHYYPFGMEMQGPWQKDTLPEAIDPKMNYRYNGKEYNYAGGLGWLDYGARSRRDFGYSTEEPVARPSPAERRGWYDPMIGRWNAVDPLAEKMPEWSPYNFVFGNPMRFVDPDGRQGEDWVQRNNGEIYWDEKATSQATTKEGETYLGEGDFATVSSTGMQTNYNSDQTFDHHNSDENVLPVATVTASEVSTGEKVGKVMQNVGDGVAMAGYFAALFTEGASLGVSAIGEGISLAGSVIENYAKISQDGKLTSDNITDVIIDASFELAPQIIEQPIKRTGLKESTKKIIKGQNRLIITGTKNGIDYQNSKKQKEERP